MEYLDVTEALIVNMENSLKSSIARQLLNDGLITRDQYNSDIFKIAINKIINKKYLDLLIKDHVSGLKSWCMDRGFAEWNSNEFKLAELWKDVVVKNSSINNSPEDVADKVVKSFRENNKLV